MTLRDEMEYLGGWLFRYRSYLPLAVVALFLPAMQGFHYPFGSHMLDEFWDFTCLTVSFLGLGIRAHVVGHKPAGTSGRNTKDQVAAALNTTGLYSVVRHPLYLGNFLMWLGVALFPRVWWFSLLITLAFSLYYERIMLAEEAHLRARFGVQFEEWARRTPAVIPSFRLWRAPDLPFSFRTLLRREQSTFLAIIVVFGALEISGDFLVSGRFQVDPIWGVILAASAIVYLVVRVLKKWTRLLHVKGR
ncbi:MAG: DUF1295 domain-containing protein [Candidatus Hydrogenedentes bacterium]|nr:DUF1295 domain-containing protein [Candidatus Hydrogenedentota bacterium]